ncbi:kinase-like domain-containing protein [Coniochaeta sp. 2T2.1]|nr:kinase-like domain-containing protein [Coniochaeta sp. 2T2.1]
MALRHQPWPPSPAVADRLDPTQIVEEEKTPYYSPDRFYAMRLGQTLNQRYQIVTKLGYGSSSTVWLAKDLHRWRWSQERFVATKVNAISRHSRDGAEEKELSILERIARTNPRHKGWHFVRKLVDSFSISEASGKHLCLVFDPLGEPLWHYCRRFFGNVIRLDILKVILQMMLHGLNYLHAECQIIHTVVKFEDTSILQGDARDEYDHPLPQKHVDGRIIYLGRNNYGQPKTPTGVIEITDFDLSVLGNVPQTGCIQAEVYRGPEVILDAGYSYSAAIWSLGVMVEGKKLFEAASPIDPNDPNGGYNDQTHLALITSLLGPPPAELLDAGRRTPLFYNPDNCLRDHHLIPTEFSFEGSLANMKDEEKQGFIAFVKRMITWHPNERATAQDSLQDPWLYKDAS